MTSHVPGELPPSKLIGIAAAADDRDRRAAVRAELRRLGVLVDTLWRAHLRGADLDPESAVEVVGVGVTLLALARAA